MSNREKIVDILSRGTSRPAELAEILGISTQALHRHLKKLVEENKIERIGNPPKVFYRLASAKKETVVDLDEELSVFLNRHYANVNSLGIYKTGVDAFIDRASGIGQTKHIENLARAYKKIRTETLQLYNGEPFLSGLQKFQMTFDKTYLENIYFQDFYSLPQFGKTRIGHLITMGKSGQYQPAIRDLAESGKPVIELIIKKHNIDAVAFIPHSIARQILFLPEYRKKLGLNMPEIELMKAFPGGIPVAQKALSKLPERIANARNTVFLKNKNISHHSVLLIDDAVGSGATLNETAAKMKNETGVQAVYAFAIAGSYKGFEVIPEI